MKDLLIGLLLSIFLIGVRQAQAQYENVWAFGTKCGLDFNSGTPKPIPTNIGLYPGTSYSAFGEGCASICDSKGQLLFYTEGFYVWDKNGNPMPNGRNLIPVYVPSIPHTPSSSTSQGVVIVPIPENDGKYYLFSLTAKESWQKRAGDLYYSIVDMSLNGGLGDIVPNEKGIFIDSFLTEKMTVARGDRCSIWLLTCSVSTTSSNFKAYEVSASGVNTTAVVSNTGFGSIVAPIGTLAISPDGKKAMATQGASWGGRQGAALFDFDATTGLFSNKIQLLDCCGGYGAAFSLNGTKVYVSTYNNTIYQYDLSYNDPAAILASELRLGAAGFSHVKLGPDGKIYFISLRNNPRPNSPYQLGVINYPDSAGKACGYVEAGLDMLVGQKMHAGLPNCVTIVPYQAYQSSQNEEGACWANVTPPVLVPKSVEPGWNYIWNDGLTESSRKVVQPGTYWMSYKTPPCIKHTDTFHVAFPYGVLPDIGTQHSCNGGNNGKAWASTYSEDTVRYHYTWTNKQGDTLSVTDTLKDVPAASYTLKIHTDYCDTSLSFVLSEDQIRVSFLTDSITCQGSRLHFINRSDTGFSQFLWDFSAKDTSSLRDPEYVFDYAGQYQVQLTGIGGICRDSITKTIIVDSLLTGKFLAQPDNICSGESITFLALTDSTTLDLHWDFGNGVALASGNVQNLQHAFDVSGNLPVTLTLEFRACPGTSFTDTVYVAALPQIDLGRDTMLCIHNSPVILRNHGASNDVPSSYLWSTGDTTEFLQVLHPGVYSLRLETEPLGCSSTESVTIKKGCYIDIPNVFTPNSDGINDFFFPRQILAEKIQAFKMQIWNRYGQVIFETENISGRGWDGKFNGKQQPVGAYVYSIDVLLVGGITEKYKGNVTLLQ